MSKLSPVQMEYIEALALRKTLGALLNERCEAAGLDFDNDPNGAFDITEQIKVEIGYDVATERFFAAENAVIEWGRTVALRLAKKHKMSKAQIADLNLVYDTAANYGNYKIRVKVIDATMRLDAK